MISDVLTRRVAKIRSESVEIICKDNLLKLELVRGVASILVKTIPKNWAPDSGDPKRGVSPKGGLGSELGDSMANSQWRLGAGTIR